MAWDCFFPLCSYWSVFDTLHCYVTVCDLTWRLRWAAPPSGLHPEHECGSEISWEPRPAPCLGSPFRLPHSWYMRRKKTEKLNIYMVYNSFCISRYYHGEYLSLCVPLYSLFLLLFLSFIYMAPEVLWHAVFNDPGLQYIYSNFILHILIFPLQKKKINQTHSKTSLLNCFCRLPRNSPIICLLSPFLCSRKWATPTGVSGMNPLSVRYWMPFSGFLKKIQHSDTGQFKYRWEKICLCLILNSEIHISSFLRWVRGVSRDVNTDTIAMSPINDRQRLCSCVLYNLY